MVFMPIYLKGTVHQCFIQINDHAFLSMVKHRHLWKEVFSWRLKKNQQRISITLM